MRKKIEALFYGRRWRADEHAWGVWQNLWPLVPRTFADLDSGRPIAGRVYRVYQQAHRGTKAVVHFGDAVGPQDTWWEHMRPAANQWVVVRTHLWFPPGTHSGQHVVWVDHWESRAAGDVYLRAVRHERRLEKERPKTTSQADEVRVSGWSPHPGEPLFETDAFAAAADVDGAVGVAAEIAAGLDARTFGPAGIGRGRLLSIWPAGEVPTFVTVTARPISPGVVWVAIATQGLAFDPLSIGGEVKAALESRLGSLGDGVLPPPREVEYDREESRRLEGETQAMLEEMAAEPSSRDRLREAIYGRELQLARLTGLGL